MRVPSRPYINFIAWEDNGCLFITITASRSSIASTSASTLRCSDSHLDASRSKLSPCDEAAKCGAQMPCSHGKAAAALVRGDRGGDDTGIVASAMISQRRAAAARARGERGTAGRSQKRMPATARSKDGLRLRLQLRLRL